MKCPKCGNEVNQDEAFCGQCGTPMLPRPQATQMVQPPHSGQLNSYNSNMPSMPPSSQPNKTRVVPPTNPYNPNNAHRPATYGGNSIAPNANQPPAPNQGTGFYQDATEAMSVFPPGNTNQVYPPGYPQQGLGGTPMQGGYPGSGQYNPQVQPPMQAGNYTRHGFPQTPQFPAEQGYGYPSQPQPAPKKQGSALLVIASVCLVVAILAVIAFGAFYLLRGNSSQRTSVTPTPVPTSIPTPTVVPTATPTPVATATPTPIPSPTVAPTPAPDANFSWCTTACTTNGFIVEFPNGWNEGQTSDKTGVQFLNPSSPDAYAAFKTPTPNATETATDLINGDLVPFTSQSGYTAPTATNNQTIGGTNWTYVIAHYTLNNQEERIEVFATVYQKKDYIIELQAAESQFDTTYYPTYFQKMINSFQFQQSTT